MQSEKSVLFTSHAPQANLYGASPVGTYVKAMAKVRWVLQQKSAGTNTGTATITVLAASANSGTGAVPVAFRWRKKTTATTSDAWGAVTDSASTGFTTVANENTIYEIEVEPTSLPDGKGWVALKLTQVVADAVDGAVLGYVVAPRYQGQSVPTLLS